MASVNCTTCSTAVYNSGLNYGLFRALCPKTCIGTLFLKAACPLAGSVMQLLTRMYGPGGAPAAADDLGRLVPRLWPFFRHTLTSVRKSCVHCLQTLLSADSGKNTKHGVLAIISARTCRYSEIKGYRLGRDMPPPAIVNVPALSSRGTGFHRA